MNQYKTNVPCAFLFCNGRAAFLDKDGNQIIFYQGFGWKGLHLFLEEYPDADVHLQKCTSIKKDYLRKILSQLRDPRL